MTPVACFSRRPSRSVTVALVLAALFVGMFFRRDLGTWYVRHGIMQARLPAEEVAAYRRMNHWINLWTYGYSVETADANGVKFRPWVTGDYERVAIVRIRWENGSISERTLLTPDSLSYIFGE